MQSKKGFSLIELLVVISILAVLATIGFFAYKTIFQGARDTKRQSDLKSIQSALEQYRSDQFHYPQSTEIQFGKSFPLNGSKIYLRTVPCDPKTDNSDCSKSNYPQYLYQPSTGCDTTKCLNYCLHAQLENPNASITTPDNCKSIPPPYNFAVTKP